MYQILCDGETLYHPLLSERKVLSANLSLELNKAGTLEMVLPYSNELYGKLKIRTSLIQVYDDNEIIFEGYPFEPSRDLYGNLSVVCVGILSFLNDTVQLPFAKETFEVADLFKKAIDYHNMQVGDDKQFVPGFCDVKNNTETGLVVRGSENPMSTWEFINDKLLKGLKGYLIITYENDQRVLNYLSTMEEKSEQNVKLSVNLIDIEDKIDTSTLATVLYPFGAKIKDEYGNETGERHNIEKINNGKYYVVDERGIADKGWIAKSIIYDDITLPENLIKAAERDLKAMNFSRTIDITAADLSKAGYDVKPFKIGTVVHVDVRNLNIHRDMLIKKMNLDLLKPEDFRLQIGDKETDFTSYFSSFEPPTGMTGPAGTSLKSVIRYYKLSDTVPKIDDTCDTTEPGYNNDPNSSLYYSDRFEYTNGTVKWGAVVKSSSYEHSKGAMIKAQSIESVTEAQQDSINGLDTAVNGKDGIISQLQELKGQIESYKRWVEIVMEDTPTREAGIYIKQNNVDRLAIVAEEIQFSEQDGTETTFIRNRQMDSDNISTNNVTFRPKDKHDPRSYKLVAEEDGHFGLRVE